MIEWYEIIYMEYLTDYIYDNIHFIGIIKFINNL